MTHSPILELRRPSEDEWWDIAARCPYATFFHTPAWAAAARYYASPARDATLAVTLENGTRVIVPLVYLKGRLKLSLAVLSTFAGCYGGLIADGPLPESARTSIYATLSARLRRHLIVKANPFHPPANPLAFRCIPDTTQVLRLDGGLDAVLRGFSKGHRSAVNRARRLGVTVRLADSKAEWRSYYLLYRGALGRWGSRATSRYPWSFFRGLHSISRCRPEVVRLWIADWNGEAVGGACVFYWNRRAFYWHAATSPDGMRLHSAHAVVAEVLNHACTEGRELFDFGPSGGHDGVAAFKRHFGSQDLSAPTLVAGGPFARFAYHFTERTGKLVRFARSFLTPAGGGSS